MFKMKISEARKYLFTRKTGKQPFVSKEKQQEDQKEALIGNVVLSNATYCLENICTALHISLPFLCLSLSYSPVLPISFFLCLNLFSIHFY